MTERIAPGRTVVRPGCGLLAALIVTVLFFAPAASADIAFGPPGTGAGGLENPQGIAVSDATGDVYVAEGVNNGIGNARVSVFDEDGDFIRAFGWGVDTGANALEVCTTASGCQQGVGGSGAGQLNGSSPRVAVDNNPLSPSFGDVFVYESGNSRVERFTSAGAFVLAFGDGVNQTTGGDVCTAASGNTCKAGVSGFGPGQFSASVQTALGAGTVYVADIDGSNQYRVQAFDSDGTLIGQPLTGSVVGNRIYLAADSAGNFYLGNRNLGVRKYSPAGACLGFCDPDPPLNASNVESIAVDGTSGEIFVARAGPSIGGSLIIEIARYAPAGTPLSAIYGEELDLNRSEATLAARTTTNGVIYAIRENNASGRIAHIPIPTGPVVLPLAPIANPIGNTGATLRVFVNPEGEATTYHLEYITDAEHTANGNSFTGANPATSTPEEPVGSDFTAHSLGKEITGLTPETTYHVRAVATDGVNTDTGPEGTFITREPFEFGETYSTEVGADTATLHAELNPLGIAATGRFQYVTEAEFQANGFLNAQEIPDSGVFAPPLDFGSGSSELSRSVFIVGLEPDTAYRYRLVAEDSFVTKAGAERTFHTFAAPDPPDTDCTNQQFRADLPSAHLPDCRAYEMVSPPEKGGGDVAREESLHLTANAFFTQNSMMQASPEGTKLAYSSVQRFADPDGAPATSQYIASRDPLTGWQTDNITPPRRTPAFYPALEAGRSPITSFSADLCTAFLRQDTDIALAPGDKIGYPDLYRRHNCDLGAGSYDLLSITAPPTIPPGLVSPPYSPRVQGFSADGSVVVFRANDRLPVSGTNASSAVAGAGAGGPISQLYIHNGSILRLVSVLPNGSAVDRASSVGNFNQSGVTNQQNTDTLENGVSVDAKRVYWETLDRAGESADHKLYVRVNPTIAQSPISAGQCTDPVRACTYPVSETVDPGPAEFQAATPDGARALFSFSGGARSGELYLYDLAGRSSTPIASGLLVDSLDPKGILGASEDLSRVYFASRAVLDAGATTGKPNLYLYEEGEGVRFIATTADGTEDSLPFASAREVHFSRVSPDGAHAAFVSSARLTGYDNTHPSSGLPTMQVFLYDAEAGGGAGELHCVSCNPSGARPGEARYTGTPSDRRWAAALPPYAYDLYPSRPLAEDGSRLFFDSYDTLLSADTNGAKDVYEWQEAGTGGCEVADADYFEQNGGCLSLISTGKDARASSFIDASMDGSDVFFSTGERLHGDDPDTLIDFYDARVGGGFPAPAVAGVPCEGEACRGAGSSPSDAPGAGTGSFEGQGNPQVVWPPQKKRCPRGKRKATRKGKTRCVPRKAKKRHAAGHNRRAAR